MPTVEWVDLAEARKRTGRSKTTIERLAYDGAIVSKLEPREGRKPERLYHAGSLERYLVEKENGKLLPAVAGGAAVVPIERGDFVKSAQALMAEWWNRHQQVEKLWLTIDEARELSGFSRKYLIRACDEGKLEWTRDGRRRLIRRVSLKAYSVSSHPDQAQAAIA